MNKVIKHSIDYPSYITLSESGELEDRLSWSPARSAPGNVGLTASMMNGAFAGQVSFRLYQASDLILAKSLHWLGRMDPAPSL
ncbi:MAG: hypothetical protein LUQ36_10310 [Methanoregula sp.]|jgi:hypothetical protein|nr:hypothetical protein [Methanoregula sp.]